MAIHFDLMKAFFVIPGLILATQLLAASTNQSGCFRYEPDTVRVSGTITRHAYYGAPGFGEDPQHDAKEIGFYLDLPKPICMQAGSDGVDTSKDGIRRIQLVLDEAGYARLRPFLGKRVTLRGTLFGAITGHHHTPVLLNVLRPAEVER